MKGVTIYVGQILFYGDKSTDRSTQSARTDFWWRFWAAVNVFTGKYDAVCWNESGDYIPDHWAENSIKDMEARVKKYKNNVHNI